MNQSTTNHAPLVSDFDHGYNSLADADNLPSIIGSATGSMHPLFAQNMMGKINMLGTKDQASVMQIANTLQKKGNSYLPIVTMKQLRTDNELKNEGSRARMNYNEGAEEFYSYLESGELTPGGDVVICRHGLVDHCDGMTNIHRMFGDDVYVLSFDIHHTALGAQGAIDYESLSEYVKRLFAFKGINTQHNFTHIGNSLGGDAIKFFCGSNDDFAGNMELFAPANHNEKDQFYGFMTGFVKGNDGLDAYFEQQKELKQKKRKLLKSVPADNVHDENIPNVDVSNELNLIEEALNQFDEKLQDLITISIQYFQVALSNDNEEISLFEENCKERVHSILDSEAMTTTFFTYLKKGELNNKSQKLIRLGMFSRIFSNKEAFPQVKQDQMVKEGFALFLGHADMFRWFSTIVKQTSREDIPALCKNISPEHDVNYIRGDGDRVSSWEDSEAYQMQCFPEAALNIIDNCGHAPQMATTKLRD